MSSLGNKDVMAKNIKIHMESAGVTAKDICSTLNIPMATFSDWIHAKTYPRIDKIEMLVFIENRSIVSSCSTLVNPGRHIPSYISEINHITDLDVEGKPRIEEIIKKIWNKIDGNIVVGHNVTFDLSFIKRARIKISWS